MVLIMVICLKKMYPKVTNYKLNVCFKKKKKIPYLKRKHWHMQGCPQKNDEPPSSSALQKHDET